MNKAYYSPMPSVLCKIFGMYKVFSHNKETDKKVDENVVVMENIFYQVSEHLINVIINIHLYMWIEYRVVIVMLPICMLDCLAQPESTISLRTESLSCWFQLSLLLLLYLLSILSIGLLFFSLKIHYISSYHYIYYYISDIIITTTIEKYYSYFRSQGKQFVSKSRIRRERSHGLIWRSSI